MKISRFLVLGILLLAAGGCAVGTQYRAATESWVGGSIEEVIAAWGNPNNTEPLPQGERFYQWVEVIWEGPDFSQAAALAANDPTVNLYSEYVCRREIYTDMYGRIKTAWNDYDCWRSDNIPEARRQSTESRE